MGQGSSLSWLRARIRLQNAWLLVTRSSFTNRRQTSLAAYLLYSRPYLAQWAIRKLYFRTNSSKVLHNCLVRGRCWIERATLLDTGRAIVKTTQLGTRCMQCMAECNNCILYAIRPRPMWQEKSFRTLDPLSAFQGGSGHETSLGPVGKYWSLLVCWCKITNWQVTFSNMIDVQ